MPNSQSMPWRLVIAGCIGMFAATATGSTRAPFLPDMAADLGVSLPAVANLFGVTAAVWGISSYLIGYASDRVGRRVFLIASPALLAVTMLAASQVQSYWTLVVIIVLAALCCGAFTSSALAEVSLRTHSSHQGRALGYVMSGQSLTLLIGVPLAAWIGAAVGWRGTHIALAVLALLSVAGMVFGLGSRSTIPDPAASRSTSHASVRRALTGPVIRLFIALIAERICFGLAAFYYASYLRTSYNLPIEAVALPLAGFALGNVIGTLVGGQIADRFPYRRICFSVALVSAGCVALPWFLWQPGATITITLGVIFAFFDAIARPPLLAALAEVPEDVRGLVMGLNSSVASIGWLTAALLGGWLYATVGFASFGPLMSAMAIVAALVVIPDSRIRAR